MSEWITLTWYSTFAIFLAVSGISCALSAGLPGQTQVGKADFYVAPDGSDSNPGTKDRPFATIARARDEVRKEVAARPGSRKSAGLTRDVLVLIRGGTYEQAGTLDFGPEDSGTEEHSITYAAYPGEEVVVSGGRKITGWKKGQAEIWTAELPDVKAGRWYFRQLFVNGRRAVRARTPNIDDKKPWCAIRKSSLVEGSWAKSTDVFHKEITVTVDHPIKAWKNVSDVEFVWLNNNDGSRKRLAGADEQAQTFTLAPPYQWPPNNLPGYYHIGYPIPPYPGYFENALEMLDEPGEWYLDRTTGILSYWPRPGEDLTQAQVVAPVVQNTLLSVAGAPGQPVRNLRFQGLHVQHVDWPLPAYGYVAMFGCLQLTSDEGKPPVKFFPIDAAVTFRYARGCNFTDGGVAHVGGNALTVFTGCAANVIEGNHLHDIGGGGIFAGIMRNRHTWQWAEPRAPGEQVGYRIANNHVHDCGKDYFGAVGIMVANTKDSVVAHNLVHDISYSGMVLAGNETPEPPFAANNVVEYNDVYDVMKVASDGAGIYASFPFAGAGAMLRGNVFHDNVPSTVNPREPGPWGAPGIYLDDVEGGALACRNYTFQGNAIFRSTQWPLFFNGVGRNNRFIDNVFLTNGMVPAAFAEALQARAGLEPDYRRRLLKTDDPGCNYYPLTKEDAASTAWSACQFDLPQAGKGVVEVFRRAECKTESLRVKTRGLNPAAAYDLAATVGNYDPKDEILLSGVTPAGSPGVLAEGKARMSGRQLMEDGLLVRLATRPQVAWVVYERVKGLAAMAEADCPRGEIPLAVVLDGSHSWAPGGTMRKFRWDLGDGATAEGATVRHTYRAPGTYVAKLTVTDDKGAANQGSVSIVATPVDATPPAIASVDCRDPEHVVVTFSEPVEPASAQAATNYAMDKEVRILSAAMGEGGAAVTLTTSPLSVGATYRLTVNRVKDRARNPNVIAADSRTDVRYNDMLAHWKLDESKGDTAADSSGNGHNGTLRNGPQWASEPDGAALSFGGKSYVEMDTCFPELAAPLTIALWVNPAPAQVQNADILGNHGDNFVGMVLQQDGDNANAFSFGYGDGTRWLGTGPVKLAANAWQHVAVVIDGRSAAIYVNGVEKSGTQAKGPLAPNPDLHFMLGMGYAPNHGRCFQGLLRDVRIYRRALGAEEIADMAGPRHPKR